MKSVSPDEMAAELKKYLDIYADQVGEVVADSAKTIARSCSKDIRTNAESAFPKGSGDYAKDWASKQTSKGSIVRGIEYTVYNKKHYRLAHLLEFGHQVVPNEFIPAFMSKTGEENRVDGRAHIRPAAQKAATDYVQKLERDIPKI